MEATQITYDWTLTFGKYKGVKIGDIPPRYLRYLIDQDIAKGDLRNFLYQEMAEIDDKIELTPITNQDFMPFGVFKGQKISTVPARYLLALLKNPEKLKDTNRMLFNYIHKDKKNIEMRDKIEKRNYFSNKNA